MLLTALILSLYWLLTESLLMSVAKLLQVVLTVGNTVEHSFQGLVCTSKYGKCGYAEWKIAKKSEKKWGIVGDHVGHCVQGPVHISKYGKCGYAEWKISIK